MAITKAALQKVGGFDPMFTSAGDDVDLSWRLAASNETLAYAPGAVVIHDRRATLGAYLKQQRGYGIGEGLLFRKYPLRNADQDGMYAGPSWIGSLLGGARVYYGEFGRGLFQTVYSAGNSYADLPLAIQWIELSLILLMLGSVSRSAGRTRQRWNRGLNLGCRSERRISAIAEQVFRPDRANLSLDRELARTRRSQLRARIRQMAI